jgi:hypothetical protein
MYTLYKESRTLPNEARQDGLRIHFRFILTFSIYLIIEVILSSILLVFVFVASPHVPEIAERTVAWVE